MRKITISAMIFAALLLVASCGGHKEAGEEPSESITEGRENTVSETPAVEALQTGPPEKPQPKAAEPPDTVEGFSYYLDSRLPEDVREVVLDNRSRLFVNVNPNFLENPGKYIDLDYDEAVDDWLVEILETPRSMEPLTLEVVEKDLDFLMTYLKYAYGAYQYYGGDDVFIPMKETILNELREKNSETIREIDYSYALYANISDAIIDCHFVIGDRRLSEIQKHMYFIQNAQYAFDKAGDSFYIELDGKSYELISIDHQAPSDMLVPYLDESGHVVWIVGYPSVSVSWKDCSLLLYHEESGETIEIVMELSGVTAGTKFDNAMYNEYELDGVQVVESRRCMPTDDEPDMYKVMGEAAEALRDRNIIVVDLRDNQGGSANYPRTWLSSLLETDTDRARGVFASHRTKTTYYTLGRVWMDTYEEFKKDGLYEGWTGPYTGDGGLFENRERLFIVLANYRTGSAGEDFVDYLRQTENAILVGTNTAGAYSTGDVVGLKMPYSGVYIRCGMNLHLEPDLTSIEGIGIEPDIWCPPDESLERVIKFIENYGLAD